MWIDCTVFFVAISTNRCFLEDTALYLAYKNPLFTSRPFLKTAGGIVWGASPYPPYPPSPRMFCFISRLLLKLAFLNLACSIYAKTILLKCF